MKYLLHFRFEEKVVKKILPDNWRIWDVKDGFWVDDQFNPTRTNDAKYWIPPSQVLFVQKGLSRD